MTSPFRNLPDIKAANAAIGHTFFDRSHRDSPVSRRIYRTDTGAVLVTSASDEHGRRYRVWFAAADGCITPQGGAHPTDTAAHTYARNLAALDGWGNR